MGAQITNNSVASLQKCMALAGWEILYIDLDLTGAHAKAEIKVERSDGLWIFARVDALGRAMFETFKRERSLGMSPNTKGRRPLSPQVNDIFLGRKTCLGARHMLKEMTAYIASNSLENVALPDIRRAWAGVMSTPLLIKKE